MDSAVEVFCNSLLRNPSDGEISASRSVACAKIRSSAVNLISWAMNLDP
jgi:hypothetical protein